VTTTRRDEVSSGLGDPGVPLHEPIDQGDGATGAVAGACFHCGATAMSSGEPLTEEEDRCHGCGAIVCDRCDRRGRSGKVGPHSIEDHLVDDEVSDAG